MIELMRTVLPYISGLYTLPWIIVGFIVCWLLQIFVPQEKVDAVMKKIGLIVLFFFVPPLVFRIFLDTPLGGPELFFVVLTCITIALMYLIAYLYAKSRANKQNLTGKERTHYLKTVITNQGRSAAFVGGAMFAIEDWQVPAGIFIAITGIALFAIVPYILSHMNSNEQSGEDKPKRLPWFLRLFPWYFICFVIGGILLQKLGNVTSASFGDFGLIIRFYTALTIPFALFYVGSGVHPNDFKISELRKLIGLEIGDRAQHWLWVRQIFIVTAIITPAFFAIVMAVLLATNVIQSSWFAVIVINTVLPITSTNMFLVPYGLDKRATAHAVTWSTLICVPVAVLLIWLFSFYF